MTTHTPHPARPTSEATPVLIEEWLPIRELGIESARERQAASALPPLSFLHVWWARAPLAAANGVNLAALLPPWDDSYLDKVPGLDDALRRVRVARKLDDTTTNREAYLAWVLWLAGIRGDTVAVMDRAAATGTKPKFAWRQAYRNPPLVEDLNVLHRLLNIRWGTTPRMVDPTAGGGSIPFSAIRYGIPAIANDLNPIAVSVLESTLKAPSLYGTDLTDDLRIWGQRLVDRCQQQLAPFYELADPDEHVTAYILANTVNCPHTGGPVALSPNWWLSRKNGGVAIRPRCVLTTKGEPSHQVFDIVENIDTIDYDPAIGSVKRGTGISPWADGLVIDGDHIKQEAQAGRMSATLIAVAARKKKTTGRGWDRYFRAPTDTDIAAIAAAETELARLAPEWAATDILPTESIPEGLKTAEPHRYGLQTWRQMFTPRQQLAHGVFIEQWRLLVPELHATYPNDPERAKQIATLLAFMQGKAVNYNAKLCAWHPTRGTVANVFDRHDFSFKWSFAEFDAGHELYPWTLDQLLDAYQGIATLLEPATTGDLTTDDLEPRVPGEVTVTAGSAADLINIDDNDIELVNIDPPYYQNVMYAELADFFYVWEKRTLGVLYPDRFALELTDKDNEAVANEARFPGTGARRRELARFDYQQKMAAIFTESRRVLRDDGVMVVWFTHKDADAWDALGTAMMDAGFTIEASWPVHTQPKTSLHHAEQNSAESTVMLVCRKRTSTTDEPTFFEDLEADVRQAAIKAVTTFEHTVGAAGVDLLLATYGPTLSVISNHWPVLSPDVDDTGRARRLRPEEALAVAREEVSRLRLRRLIGHEANFDAATDFWILAWEIFKARTFPYDEARRLALGVGFDIDHAAKIGLVTKKSGNVTLVTATERARRLRTTIDDHGRFPHLIDAIHHLLATHHDDGLAAARQWLTDSNYRNDTTYADALQAAINAVPRIRTTDSALEVEEARLLENAIVALYDATITIPPDPDYTRDPEQTTMDL